MIPSVGSNGSQLREDVLPKNISCVVTVAKGPSEGCKIAGGSVVDSMHLIDLNSSLDPQCKVKQLDWGSVPETHGSFISFAEKLQALAALEPDAVCNAWLDKTGEVVKSFTRAQLWCYSGNVASMLVQSHNVQRGDRLMVVFPFGIEWIVSFLACLRIGAVVVSVYPPDPQRLARDVPKFAHFVEDSGSCIALTVTKYKQLVTSTSLIRKWPAGVKWIATDPCFVLSSKSNTSSPAQFDVSVKQDDLAIIQYTSGSTGNPKGIMMSHANLAVQCQTLHKGFLGVASKDNVRGERYVGWAPQYHDMGLFTVLASLYSGTDTAYTFSPLDWLQNPTMWPRAIEKFKGTFTAGPNFSLELTSKRLLQQKMSFDCSSIAWAILGGEPTRLSTLREAAKTMRIPYHALHNSWGLAECCVYVSSFGRFALENTVGCSLLFPRSCGIDVRIAVKVDGELVEAAEGFKGEICVRSATVALGYWNQKEISERTFQAKIQNLEGNYLRTGDMGCIASGEFFVLSRIKDLIIVNGKNFAPSDLEATAETAFKAVRPGSSVAFQSKEAVVLVCELRKAQQSTVSVDTLVLQIQSAVEAEHGVTLDRVLLVEERSLPKTTSGKVQRSKTATMYKEGVLQQHASTSSHGAGTSSLAACKNLREMLAAMGVQQAMDSTLAENGISSLQLIHAAEKTLALELSLEQLTESTAEELCSISESSGGAQGKEVAVNRQPLAVCPEVDVQLPPMWMRMLRQLFVVVVILLCFVGATIPSIVFVEKCFDAETELWVSNGRGGPFVLGAVVIWMLTFSCICVLLKWLLVGKRQPNTFCVMWSNVMLWMIVERLLATWEFTVGRFLLDTPWINLFYSMLGASLGWDARLHTFFRDCDMVTIGRGSSVKGKLYGRVFTRTGMHFGRVEVGEHVSLGSATVVQPFTEIRDKVSVEACCVVPTYSALLEEESIGHGNPCRQRSGAEIKTATSQAALAGGPTSNDPLFVTRLAFPLLFMVLTSSAVALLNYLLPESSWSEPFGKELLWMTTSTMIIFCCSGLSLFLFTVLLKWSFLSPWVTDHLAATVVTVYFSWLEKTFLVPWWHRAFGMSIGSSSVVIYSTLCSPSSAHLVGIGSYSFVFNSALVPRDTPSLWSWLAGRTASPWHWGSKDIKIGSSVAVYAQSRVESATVLEDGVKCGGFSRVLAGARIKTGQTTLGNPAVCMRTTSAPAETPLRTDGHRAELALHPVLLMLHVVWLAGMATVGLHLMLTIGKDDQNGLWTAYLRIPVRVLFQLAWLHLMLVSEVVIAKWVLVGSATPENFALMSYKGVCCFHLHCLDSQMDGLLGTLSCGLFLVDIYYMLLGFNIQIGKSFINSTYMASSDADLVTIRPGTVIDDSAYVLAHEATMAGYETSRAFVSSGVILHPQSGIFRGSVGEGSSLFARSKPLWASSTFLTMSFG